MNNDSITPVHPLQPNPDTGFLDGNSINAFTSAKKVKFLELALQQAREGNMPDLNAILDVVMVSNRTFYEHLERDEKFKEAWEECKDRVENELVKTMTMNAKKPGGYMDRITWLRAFRPGRWNPDKKVILSHENAGTKRLEDIAKGAIEGEIVVDKPQLKDGNAG